MSNVLILDDNLARHREFDRILTGIPRKHVYTAPQAIAALRDNPPFDLVCLDHDLGDFENRFLRDDPGTGADVALFINLHLDRSKYPKKVMVHSWNTEGAKRMSDLIRRVGIPVTVKPFHI